MQRRRVTPLRVLLLLFATAVLLAVLLNSVWLPWLGSALVRDDGPSKADMAVVLGGDYYGNRILKAAELVKAGYVRAALVSGPAEFYGFYESDLAIPFAVHHGYPADMFIPFPNRALSTREEAPLILGELRKRGVHSFLLITSDFHTARAARVFEAALKKTGGGLSFRVTAAPHHFFQANNWWRSRESQKTVFLEWSKTVASAFGI